MMNSKAGAAWSHTHTLGVVQDKVFLKFDTGLALITFCYDFGAPAMAEKEAPSRIPHS